MTAEARDWIAKDPDPETRAKLEEVLAKGDVAELGRAFAARLEFGTAGLRGIVGPGPARMNRLVVQETTAGLAAYLIAKVPAARTRGVIVGYDGRTHSRLFAEDVATVLAASGVVAHCFTREMPTPVCAFAVQRLGAAAGVVVTASHNPPEYNGYKVYWENGAQIIPPHDQGIARAIDEAARGRVAAMPIDEARRAGLVKPIGEELLESYLAGVMAASVHRGGNRALRIAYTPLHGVGAAVAEAALAKAGFTEVSTAASQRQPDGRFPTVRFPNPEEAGAMDAVIGLARERGADLACANDPDADRFAVAVRQKDGAYRMLSGNDIGALLGWDLLRAPPANALVVTTIVSSRLLSVLARARGVAYAETLTGFKWIANAGLVHEAKGGRFLFGYEEALGYCIGSLVRDKDGISALVAFCELAAAEAEAGKTVLDRLEAIAREHGLFVTAQKSLALSPERRALGELLRHEPPTMIAGRRVEVTTDVLRGEQRQADGSKQALALPASDVLIYDLEGAARVIVRPSGTEPKLKCYYELRTAVGRDEPHADAERRAGAELDALAGVHQQELASLT
jgi:phosphomannomutase